MADTDLSAPPSPAETRLVELEQSPDRWTDEGIDSEITDIRERLYPSDGPRPDVVTEPESEDGVPDFSTVDGTNAYRDALVSAGHEGIDALFDSWGPNAQAQMQAAQRFADANPAVLEMAEALASSGEMSVVAILKLAPMVAPVASAAPALDGPAPATGSRAGLEAEAERLAGLPEAERWSPRVDNRLKAIRKQLNPGTFNRFGGGLEGRS